MADTDPQFCQIRAAPVVRIFIRKILSGDGEVQRRGETLALGVGHARHQRPQDVPSMPKARSFSLNHKNIPSCLYSPDNSPPSDTPFFCWPKTGDVSISSQTQMVSFPLVGCLHCLGVPGWFEARPPAIPKKPSTPLNHRCPFRANRWISLVDD